MSSSITVLQAVRLLDHICSTLETSMATQKEAELICVSFVVFVRDKLSDSAVELRSCWFPVHVLFMTVMLVSDSLGMPTESKSPSFFVA